MRPRWNFELGRHYEFDENDRDLELAELRYRAGMKRIKPGMYTGPHLYLGRVLVKRGRFREAAFELKRLLEIKPPTPQGYLLNAHYREAQFLLGVAQFNLGQRDASREAFVRYIDFGGNVRYAVGFFPDIVAGE